MLMHLLIQVQSSHTQPHWSEYTSFQATHLTAWRQVHSAYGEWRCMHDTTLSTSAVTNASSFLIKKIINNGFFSCSFSMSYFTYFKLHLFTHPQQHKIFNLPKQHSLPLLIINNKNIPKIPKETEKCPEHLITIMKMECSNDYKVTYV